MKVEDSVWNLVTGISNSAISILHLDSANTEYNPFLINEIDKNILEHNKKVADANDNSPLINKVVTGFSFSYRPMVKTLINTDPTELALSELMRHKGAGVNVRPVSGYHLFIEGQHITFSQEKTIMEGDFADVSSFFLAKITGKKRDRAQLTAKPLARHFFNYIYNFYVKESTDSVEKIRRDIASRQRIALGTALAFFGLKTDASKEELVKARKQLLAKAHPDLVDNDPKLREESEKLSMKINQTYEFILSKMPE